MWAGTFLAPLDQQKFFGIILAALSQGVKRDTLEILTH